MKKRLFILPWLAASAAMLLSCSQLQKDFVPVPEGEQGASAVPVMFYAPTEDASRTTAVTSLSTFGVIAENTTSSAQVWKITSVTQSGSLYSTGKYWPSTDSHYAFYASNNASTLTYAASGATVAPADANTDVVVAYSPYDGASFQQNVALTFEHIFARIGTIAVNAPSGYSLTVNSLSLSAPVSGTYNIKTATWSSKGSAASQTIAVGSNDVYVVPGAYTLSVNYTISLGDYSETLTKTGSVNLQQGKINSITATAPVSATEIIFTVTVTPWGSNGINVNLI